MSDDPRYRQLADDLEGAIAAGRLVPGTRLPSIREFRETHHISVTTAVQAYRTLEERGLVDARPKSGYFVAPRRATLRVPALRTFTDAPKPVEVHALFLEVQRKLATPGLISLSSSLPDPRFFPNERLQRVLASVVRRHPLLPGLYAEGQGLERLRIDLSRRMGEHGCFVDPEEILITNGAIEATNLALRAVAKPGECVAIESPTYYGLLEVLEGYGLRAVEIPTSATEGMSLADLVAALDRTPGIKAVLTIPNFQNPSGAVMPDAAKEAMVRLVTERGITLIEDDVYGDLHHGKLRPRPMKAWDTAGHVIHCSSFSKTVAPGFRIGWMAGGRHQEQLRALKFLTTIGTAEIAQHALSDYMRRGSPAFHLRRLRTILASQVEQFADEVRRHFPAECALAVPVGGYFLWVELPPGVDSMTLFNAAIDKGLAIQPGAMFASRNRFGHCIRLSAGLEWDEERVRGVRALGALVHALRR